MTGIRSLVMRFGPGLAIVASMGVFPDCGKTSPTAPTVAAISTSTTTTVAPTFAVPAPPREGCEPWPKELGEMFAKLPLPPNLCLIYDGSTAPSTGRFLSGVVIGRFDGNPFGIVASIAHELGHAHQYWAIRNAGFPDLDPRREMEQSPWTQEFWQQTQEGKEYHAAGGWVFSGFTGVGENTPCGSWTARECWAQDTELCEWAFCHTPSEKNMTGYANPKEENAEFIGEWYNPTRQSNWGAANFERVAPRRAAWARKWLP